MINSTLSNNSATAGSGGNIYGTGTAEIYNSILVKSSGHENCATDGVPTDGGYNIADDNSCSFTATGSLNNTESEGR